MSDGSKRLDGLVPEKLDLVLARLGEKRASRGPDGIVPRADRDALVPLSFDQESWSFGGRVAFEMARQLWKAGEAVQPVILDASVRSRIQARLSTPPRSTRPGPWRSSPRNPGSTSPSESSGTWAPKSTSDGRRGRFGGPMAFVRAEGSGSNDGLGGWTDLCSGPITVHTVSGDHHSMVKEPDVRGLAAVLRRILDEAALERWGGER